MTTRASVVIFGASGFTGERVVRTAIRKQQSDPGFSIKIAGRSLERLRQVLDRCRNVAGLKEFQVELIEADLKKPESIRSMCQQATVLINCVGPYRFYGEQVVRCCLETSTHYVDISGEPQFLESMQLKYDEEARQKGLYIIGSCGFDSIPSEMGIAFLENTFEGDLEVIETYLSIQGPSAQSAVHATTWESAVHSLANAKELGPLRRQLYQKRLPKGPRKYQEKIFHVNKDVGGYAVPFPGSDRSVARRTEYLHYTEQQQRPVQILTYMKVNGAFAAVQMLLFGVVFSLMVRFSATRDLLLKYPRVFSLGTFSPEGPTEEQMEKTTFTLRLFGLGHKEKIVDADRFHTEPPTEKMVVEVSGPEPGYHACSIFAVEAAAVVLEAVSGGEPSIPRAGVLPPGFAFSRTSYIDRLRKQGITFEVRYQGPATDSTD